MKALEEAKGRSPFIGHLFCRFSDYLLAQVGGVFNAADNLRAGNYGAAALDALGVLGNAASFLRACFGAGTPLLTPDGEEKRGRARLICGN